MVQSLILKILLFPFAVLYGIGVGVRNFFYNRKILLPISFDIPTISIGNLNVGGSGKSPHIEYLVRTLQYHIYIATLSRGYKRKTTGFMVVEPFHSAREVGDEPLQFKRKFPRITVAVGENRVFAIPEIIKNNHLIQTVLLDDAYQHRAITPGLNILLTEYRKPFFDDYILPVGRLREWRSGYKRADIIIISKCPIDENDVKKEKIEKGFELLPHQSIFYSYYKYGTLYNMLNPDDTIHLEENLDVIVISAIANSDYLTNYISGIVKSVHSIEFEDHHYFSNHEISNLVSMFENHESENKIIITTEKDSLRLELHRAYIIEKGIKIYVLPVEVDFHFGENEKFNTLVKDFLLNFKA